MDSRVNNTINYYLTFLGVVQLPPDITKNEGTDFEGLFSVVIQGL